MSQSLSPAAQAVLDAFLRAPCDNELSVAAALRAAADQVVPGAKEPPEQAVPDCNDPWNTWNARQAVRRQLLAIAAELEASR